ncbi:hypothetical protein I3843_11G067700 [Carya illinoinensis]|nr:hypothetical protein I3843_11G067700 [Carya illinoinensis]
MHITRCIAIQHGVHSMCTPFLLRHTSLQHTSHDASLHYTEYASRVLSSHYTPYHICGIHLTPILHNIIHNATQSSPTLHNYTSLHNYAANSTNTNYTVYDPTNQLL